MLLLPVVQRELAVSARRPTTYRARMIAVVLASLFGAFGLWGAAAGGGATTGAGLLNVFSPVLLAFCLFEGARSTADCLSSEKRAGTLGLLFLTDLTGLDVVLGKLAANSLRVSFALLGVLPVAALTLLLGGVSGPELTRLALALGSVLWFSLTLGLAVSAVSREEGRAWWGTLAGLLIACAGPLVASAAVGLIWPRLPRAEVAALSPLTAYLTHDDLDYAARPGAFWISLATSGLAGLAFVGFAGWAAPRFWGSEAREDRPIRQTSRGRRLPLTGIGETQPGAWLAMRHWQTGRRRRLVGALASVAGGSLLLAGFLEPPAGALILPFLTLLPFKVVLTLGTCQFFARLQQEGMLDSLRTTPAGEHSWPDQFATGTQRAWRTVFGILFGSVFILATAASLNQPEGAAFMIFAYLAGTEALDLLALYWTGAWLALRSGRATAAATRAVLWVHQLPSLLCCGLRAVVDLFVWSILRERLRQGWHTAGLAPAVVTPTPARGKERPPPLTA
jgi:hypothetical protein